MKLNLGCGDDVRDGWINADAFKTGPNIVRADITKLPLPWPSESFSEVLMSHVLEHVPFIMEPYNGGSRDIIFHLFEELHSILKPNGVLHIRVPFAGTEASFCHPQHYRQVTPSWIDYFHPAKPENYYSTARFTMKRWERSSLGMKYAFRLPIRGLGLTSHIADRLPFTRRFLTSDDELQMWWVKA